MENRILNSIKIFQEQIQQHFFDISHQISNTTQLLNDQIIQTKQEIKQQTEETKTILTNQIIQTQNQIKQQIEETKTILNNQIIPTQQEIKQQTEETKTILNNQIIQTQQEINLQVGKISNFLINDLQKLIINQTLVPITIKSFEQQILSKGDEYSSLKSQINSFLPIDIPFSNVDYLNGIFKWLPFKKFKDVFLELIPSSTWDGNIQDILNNSDSS
jgi:hypothetical protein